MNNLWASYFQPMVSCAFICGNVDATVCVNLFVDTLITRAQTLAVSIDISRILHTPHKDVFPFHWKWDRHTEGKYVHPPKKITQNKIKKKKDTWTNIFFLSPSHVTSPTRLSTLSKKIFSPLNIRSFKQSFYVYRTISLCILNKSFKCIQNILLLHLVCELRFVFVVALK